MKPRKRKKRAPLTVLQRQERKWAKQTAAVVRDNVLIVDKHTGEIRLATKDEAIGTLWISGVYRLVKVESEKE